MVEATARRPSRTVVTGRKGWHPPPRPCGDTKGVSPEISLSGHIRRHSGLSADLRTTSLTCTYRPPTFAEIRLPGPSKQAMRVRFPSPARGDPAAAAAGSRRVWRDVGSAVRRGVVGEGRFELPASCSQSRRAAKLRHSPEPPSVAVVRTTEIGTDSLQSNVSELTFNPSCFIAEVTALTVPPLPHA
jgi:hypothetical protein